MNTENQDRLNLKQIKQLLIFPFFFGIPRKMSREKQGNFSNIFSRFLVESKCNFMLYEKKRIWCLSITSDIIIGNDGFVNSMSLPLTIKDTMVWVMPNGLLATQR